MKIFQFVTMLMLMQPVCVWTNRINNTSGEQTIYIDENIQFHCSINKTYDKFPVYWEKLQVNSPPLILFNGTTRIIQNDRLNVSYSSVSSVLTLKIRNIQLSDGGSYICVAIERSIKFTILMQRKLRIQRLPYILDSSTKAEIGNLGESVELKCHAGGSPVSEISWRRGDENIFDGGYIHKGTVLLLPNLQLTDCGVYICEASTGLFRTVTHFVKVFVKTKPIVSIKNPVKYTYLREHVEIICDVIAYPPAGIIWEKNGMVWQGSHKQGQGIFRSGFQEYQLSLDIFSVEKSDFSNYTCKASNELGTVTATAFVLCKK